MADFVFDPKNECNTFWGSHGCSLPKGHDPEQEHPIHECGPVTWWDNERQDWRTGPCLQAQYVTDDQVRIRPFDDDAGVWDSEWETYSAGGLFRNDEELVR